MCIQNHRTHSLKTRYGHWAFAGSSGAALVIPDLTLVLCLALLKRCSPFGLGHSQHLEKVRPHYCTRVLCGLGNECLKICLRPLKGNQDINAKETLSVLSSTRAPICSISKEAVINSSHSCPSWAPSFYFQDKVPGLFLHWSIFPDPFLPFNFPPIFPPVFEEAGFPHSTSYFRVSATPASRWEMWNKWLGKVRAAPPTLPGARLKMRSSDFQRVEGNETSKWSNLRENSERTLQELLALLITRTAFPSDRNTEWRKEVPCRRNLARA